MHPYFLYRFCLYIDRETSADPLRGSGLLRVVSVVRSLFLVFVMVSLYFCFILLSISLDMALVLGNEGGVGVHLRS